MECTKEVYVGRERCKWQPIFAVLNHNEGFGGKKHLYEKQKLLVNKHFHVSASLKDCQRIKQAIIKATEQVKKQRKILSAQRKGLLEHEKGLE